MVRLGSGCIYWSRSLTQRALLEQECWWERNPQGHGFGFFWSICFLNISNFLNAGFCSLFSTVSKGRNLKSIPQDFFFFFFLYVEVPHTALITLLYLSSCSSSPPDPSQTLGFGSFLKPIWFPFKNPFRSSCCKPHISEAMSFSNPLRSLLAVVKPGNKKKKVYPQE